MISPTLDAHRYHKRPIGVTLAHVKSTCRVAMLRGTRSEQGQLQVLHKLSVCALVIGVRGESHISIDDKGSDKLRSCCHDSRRKPVPKVHCPQLQANCITEGPMFFRARASRLLIAPSYQAFTMWSLDGLFARRCCTITTLHCNQA